MRLDHLLQSAQIGFRSTAPHDLVVTDVCDDSRRASPGCLFIARPGPTEDGSKYVADAIARGAAVVVSQAALTDVAVPIVVVSDIVKATARIASAFYGHPARSLRLLGVTGTNGKTTTAYIIQHVLHKLGIRCGLIGTVEIDDGQSRFESELTTPGAIELARLLARMRDNGCKAVAMEASSHALAQGRVDALEFAGAGFTNLTGDHLDFHGTMELYAAAKAILFHSLPATSVAIVNGDDPWSGRMVRDCRARVVRYSIEPTEAVQAIHAGACDVSSSGTRFRLHLQDQQYDLEMPLVGRHNIQNALTALGLCVEAMGVDPTLAVAALRTAAGAPGRLQRVPTVNRNQPSILVDYAHTDDALENVLSALRPLTRGKLLVVFGCGGDRDRTKRPRMLKVAQKLAHAVYVTSDNPRTENANAIIDDILSGKVADSSAEITVEPDRRRAIGRAIEDAGSGDVVLIAGKGHERYQIVGKNRLHFDDVEEAVRVLEEK
jgi:UDP-N-acetylmuramoyl-L-alanyl-D-glutamate--2,6-diaminopimelate ligase